MMRTHLAPAVLVIVALAQRYLVQQHSLDPWKGGGFGMFSGISTANLRRMTVTLVTESGEEKRFPPKEIASRIPLNGDMRWQQKSLLTMPQAASLQRLADVLAKARWVAVQTENPKELNREEDSNLEKAGRISSEPGNEAKKPIAEYYRMATDVSGNVIRRTLQLREVRVEIWEYRIDHQGKQLLLTKLIVASSSAK